MSPETPLLVSLLIALIGAGAGFAALIKQTAASSGEIAEGAADVVRMLNRELKARDERLDRLEEYTDHFDAWADRVLRLLTRAIDLLPSETAETFLNEANAVRAARPRRRHTERKENG